MRRGRRGVAQFILADSFISLNEPNRAPTALDTDCGVDLPCACRGARG